MKRSLLLTVLLSLFVLTSCNLGDQNNAWGTYPDSAAYATVHLIEDTEDSDVDKYYFETDNGIKLFLKENKLTIDYKFADQEQLIIYFTILEEYKEEEKEILEGASYGCHYGIRLFSITDLFITESATVETEEESAEIADHELNALYNNITCNYGYINLTADVRTPDINDVKFYLVENLSTLPEKTETGYLNLELRYDRGADKDSGTLYREYIRADLAPYADQLEGMKGILLRFNVKSQTSNENRIIQIKVDLPKEEEEDKDKE